MKKVIVVLMLMFASVSQAGMIRTCSAMEFDCILSNLYKFREQSEKFCDDFADIRITLDGEEKTFTAEEFFLRLGFGPTEIIVILDRSGSMETMEKDMEGGLKQFIKDQQAMKGRANLTLIQFNDEYEMVYDSTGICTIEDIDIVPKGNTALLDAIGKTLDRLRWNNRTICVIITDGLENASVEYTKSQVSELIKFKEKLGWKFIYLGANQDAIQEGGSIGFNPFHCVTFDSTNVSGTIDAMSVTVSSYRTGAQDEN